MADGNNLVTFPRSGLRIIQGLRAARDGRVVERNPQANDYGFPPVDALDREPAPAFAVDRRAGCVIWTLTGLRLREADDFRQLGNLFLTNSWPRNFNALGDAELALSEPPPEAA